MCVVVSMSTFIGLLFFLFIIYTHSNQKLQQVEWDMATVTVADYAVEFQINPESYQRWYQREYCKVGGDKENKIAPGLSLKSHLIEFIEKELTNDLVKSINAGDEGKKKKKDKR
jgi:hypothetical protein